MNKIPKSTLRVLLLIALLSPLFGCSESDDGSGTTQAQAEPAAEAVEKAAVAPPPEKEAVTVAPPMETVTVDIEEGVPGGIFTDTLDLSAEVIAMDMETRALTLKNSEGEELDIQVGPQAVNFDQIQVGDIVKAKIIKELVIGLVPAEVEMPSGASEAIEKVAPDGTAGLVAGAVKGAMPAGVMAETTQITATIEAIDMENRTATLSLEDGTTRTVPVRDDIDLSQREVGEKVMFYLTEMLAIAVEKSE